MAILRASRKQAGSHGELKLAAKEASGQELDLLDYFDEDAEGVGFVLHHEDEDVSTITEDHRLIDDRPNWLITKAVGSKSASQRKCLFLGMAWQLAENISITDILFGGIYPKSM